MNNYRNAAMQLAYTRGATARSLGASRDANPFSIDGKEFVEDQGNLFDAWFNGYFDAATAYTDCVARLNGFEI